MSNDRTKPPTSPQPLCERCGQALQAALHLPARLKQPAYDIFNCTACGFIAWVAQSQEQQTREWS